MTVITLSAKLFGLVSLGSTHFTMPLNLDKPYAWKTTLGGVLELSATATPSVIASSRSVVMDEVVFKDGGSIEDMHEPVDDKLKEFMDNTTFS